MGECKITPGPWRVVGEHDPYQLEIVGRPKWKCKRYGVSGEWGIATIDDLLEDHPGEAEANALAISLVPDMIAALREIAGNGDATGRNPQLMADAATAILSKLDADK